MEGLEKSFDGELAVDGVTFGVERGKILTLLGPSGCGKTTTLRCIAGLEAPTAGTVRIDGDVVTSVTRRRSVPAERRNIGMVFQSYAVWPHMTVSQNLGLPLEVRGIPLAERRKRIGEAPELVGLAGLENRYANRLSGGQQQRVALARALIYNPRLLLFDEPLSNLDAKLRERMRLEIRKLQREVGISSVYVTHDQAEAMIISDRIIVMNHGRIEQEGDARTLYTRRRARSSPRFWEWRIFFRGWFRIPTLFPEGRLSRAPRLARMHSCTPTWRLAAAHPAATSICRSVSRMWSSTPAAHATR